MVKDSKRFADSGGWGYAQFEYDPATEAFRPGDTSDDRRRRSTTPSAASPATRSWPTRITSSPPTRSGERCLPFERRQLRRRAQLRHRPGRMTMTSCGHQSDADKTSIRPFRVNFPDSELAELRRRINATRWPDARPSQTIARRAARDDSGARALLGDGIRLAQGRSEAERPAAISSPRSMGSTFTSFTFVRNMKMRCRSSSRTAGPARSSSS